MKTIRKILAVTIINSFLLSVSVYADEKSREKDLGLSKSELNLQEITLPSEVKDISKQSGSIYYDSSVKNKVLIPTHFWGEVNKPGLHFVPTDTTLIKGISMAGGPSGMAKLESVTLTRSLSDGATKQFSFNLAEGGEIDAHKFKIEPGDSIFIKKDQFREDRAYYTSLIGIAISILSTVVLFQKIK